MITVELSPLKHGFQCVRALRCHQGTVPDDLCSHIDHSVDLTGDGEGDDELYYSSDDEYDSDTDGKSNSDQYININFYYNAYS